MNTISKALAATLLLLAIPLAGCGDEESDAEMAQAEQECSRYVQAYAARHYDCFGEDAPPPQQDEGGCFGDTASPATLDPCVEALGNAFCLDAEAFESLASPDECGLWLSETGHFSN